jgi:CubicO group peptidase (beta-lactamase class C family)
MSMTKPFTSTAIMLLMEEGRIALSDPVEKYLPDFHEQWVIESTDSKIRTLHRAPRPVTLRDLLTHTSGMSGAPPGGASKITVTLDRSLAEVVALDSQGPLLFDPGTKWSYSTPAWPRSAASSKWSPASLTRSSLRTASCAHWA